MTTPGPLERAAAYAPDVDTGRRPAMGQYPSEVQPRPVVTLHLPLSMGLVAGILQLVAEEYRDAKLASGAVVVELPNEHGAVMSYSTPDGKASVVLARAEP